MQTLYEITYQARVVCDNILEYYSPWHIADDITKLCEAGEAKPVETRIFTDLEQFRHSSWVSSLWHLRKTIHVINDPVLVQEGLIDSRSQRFSICHSIVDNRLDHHNMAMSPSSEHTRLRAPFEKIFTAQAIEREGSTLDNILFRVNETGEAAMAMGKLTPEEQASTRNMFNLVAFDTTNMTYFFYERVLRVNSSARRLLIEAVKTRFPQVYYAPPFFNFGQLQLDESIYKALCFGGKVKGKDILPSEELHACMKELFRLYPVVPQIIRIANETFTFHGTEIQKGDLVAFNIMGCQRNALHWENSGKFDPTRFLNGERPCNILGREGLKPLLTFSIGTARCLGVEIAKRDLLERAAVRLLDISPEYVINKEIFDDEVVKTPGYQIKGPFIIPKKSD